MFLILFSICLGFSFGRAQAEVYGLLHLSPGAGYQQREAALVQASLNRDADGLYPIDGPLTANPAELLIVFRQYRPNLQLSGLVDYIRSLVPGAARPGTYETSYIESSPYTVHRKGWKMTLTAGTIVLYDGSHMVQIEGGGGVAACGNVLRVLRTIAIVSVRAPIQAPVQPLHVSSLPPMVAHCWISMAVLGYDRPQPIVVEINGRPVHTLYGSPQPRFYKVPCLLFFHARSAHLCLVGSPSGEGYTIDLDEARRAMAEAERRYRSGEFNPHEPIEVIFNRRIAVLHRDISPYGRWATGAEFRPPQGYNRVPFVFAAHVQTRGINAGVTIIH